MVWIKSVNLTQWQSFEIWNTFNTINSNINQTNTHGFPPDKRGSKWTFERQNRSQKITHTTFSNYKFLQNREKFLKILAQADTTWNHKVFSRRQQKSKTSLAVRSDLICAIHSNKRQQLRISSSEFPPDVKQSLNTKHLWHQIKTGTTDWIRLHTIVALPIPMKNADKQLDRQTVRQTGLTDQRRSGVGKLSRWNCGSQWKKISTELRW